MFRIYFGYVGHVIDPATGHALTFRAWTKPAAKARAKRIAKRHGWTGFRMIWTGC